jgi:hypothetical protein
MRFGVPMYDRAEEKKRVIITVEWPDGRVEFRLWRGWRVRHIREAARAAYHGAYLQFGRWF